MRRAGGLLSISIGDRWARRSNGIRIFPIAPTSRSFAPVDAHTIDVRFYERGAGETNSSGTGSTGAAAAAVARGMAQSPVRVLTPAGPLDLRLDNEVFLNGPAEIIGEGQYFL